MQSGHNADIPTQETAMLPNALFAFLHFVAAFGIVAAITYQWATFDRAMSHTDARRIQISDRWYGILAGVVLVVGFLRVFYFEKGSTYYFHNPFFEAKLGIFLLIGLISIYPTVRYIAWGKQMKGGQPPQLGDQEFGRIRWILRVEMGLMVVMVLAASMMAKGVLH
jgi:putative membrane protein